MTKTARLLSAVRPAASGPPVPFNPETSITWHSLFWAEGTAMTAQGYTNGASVTTWPNETSETDATEATNPPTYVAAGFKGRPTVNFASASSQQLVIPSWTTNLDYTNGVTFIVLGNTTATNFKCVFFGGNSTITQNVFGTLDNNQRWGISAGSSVYAATFSADTQDHLFRAFFDGSTGNDRLYEDEVLVIDANAGSYQANQGMKIGSKWASTGGHDGDIAFVGVYEGDFATDPNYPAFCQWVTEHYGINTGISTYLTGGTVTVPPDDGYVYHTFKSSGTLTPIGDPVEVEYLVVGGGGAGGVTSIGNSGGGGAGGLLSGTATIASAQTVTVGDGGAVTAGVGGSGGNSTFSAITSTGGGGGGYYTQQQLVGQGASGGSGGGAPQWGGWPATDSGGAGVAGQGYKGGDRSPQMSIGAAGGGGAGAAGGNTSGTSGEEGGPGGVGVEWPTGSGTYYAGGGGGSTHSTGSGAAPGGNGGGGSGQFNPNPATAGAANTGGGGGGGGETRAAGAGGSGIVIARYPVDYAYTPISPDSITGLSLWLDATDASTFVLSGSTVDQWQDKSGNARHFVKMVGGGYPPGVTTRDGSINGLTSVSFPGDAVLRSSGAFDLGSNCTLFVVINRTSGALWDSAPSATNTWRHWLSKWELWDANPAVSDGIINGNNTVLTCRISIPSSTRLAERWVDGSNYASASGVTATPVTWSTPVIGAVNSSLTPFDGAIGEFIIYSSALPHVDRSAVEAYLMDKWGI